MMRIDTSHLAGWEDKTVVLEFEHDKADQPVARCSTVRLVEFVPGEDEPPPSAPWQKVPSGWKRVLCGANARCSPADQFCRETGRRVALRRMAASKGRYTKLRKAAWCQYGETQYERLQARRRAGSGMTDDQAVAFWALMMVSDPWPLGGREHAHLLELANAEAKKRGYNSWVVAFHEFKKERP